MTCASCSNRIERFLRKTDGVVEANVNLATEVATIRYLPEAVGRAELVGAIEKAGYEVRPGALEAAEAQAPGGTSTARRRGRRHRARRDRADPRPRSSASWGSSRRSASPWRSGSWS